MTADQHPFAQPDGSDARMFIQWKNTQICVDFYCPCGEDSHLDADSVYYVQCPNCGTIYEMGTQVIAKRATPEQAGDRAKMLNADED